MFKKATLAALILVAACSDGVGPEHTRPSAPQFATMSGSGIVLDQQSGGLGQYGVHIGKGFDPVNPRRGDAIVATFFWFGSQNTITEVTDHLADGTPVGNPYTLVEYVTAGGLSMATYVATNVQNFPDSNDWNTVLDVHAIFSSPVLGGVIISAYRGVGSVSAAAIGAHASSGGTASVPTMVGPGAIPVNENALIYAVTMSNAHGPAGPPAGFASVSAMEDTVMNVDGEYAVQGAAGSVDPQWAWYFSSAGTWLASAVALNPTSLHLAFVTQPSRTLPLVTITPPVQVAVVDEQGNTLTSFTGPVTIAIGHNGGLLLPGTLAGTKTVTAVNGLATFSDLSIDQLGNGYTLKVSGPGVVGAESAPFNIGLF
jgi:hypothetical protein